MAAIMSPRIVVVCAESTGHVHFSCQATYCPTSHVVNRAAMQGEVHKAVTAKGGVVVPPQSSIGKDGIQPHVGVSKIRGRNCRP